MAGVNVVVSGGGTIVASVDGQESVGVAISGGIGPAAFVDTNSGVIIGHNPINIYGGNNITVSGSTSSGFTISGASDSQIASKSPVQSVAGRVGNVVLSWVDVTAAGVLHTHSVSQIPEFENSVRSLAAVSSVQGRTGVVVLTRSDLGAAASSHTHSASDISGLPVASVQGRTGTIFLTRTDITAAAADHTHSLSSLGAAAAVHSHATTEISGFTSAVQSFANVRSVQGKTGDVVLTVIDLTASPSSHAHPYVLSLNSATGGVVLAAGPNVSIVRDQTTITISASNNNTAAVSAMLWPAFILGG